MQPLLEAVLPTLLFLFQTMALNNLLVLLVASATVGPVDLSTIQRTKQHLLQEPW
jgi:hypothetical protein